MQIVSSIASLSHSQLPVSEAVWSSWKKSRQRRRRLARVCTINAGIGAIKFVTVTVTIQLATGNCWLVTGRSSRLSHDSDRALTPSPAPNNSPAAFSKQHAKRTRTCCQSFWACFLFLFWLSLVRVCSEYGGNPKIYLHPVSSYQSSTHTHTHTHTRTHRAQLNDALLGHFGSKFVCKWDFYLAHVSFLTFPLIVSIAYADYTKYISSS